MGYNIPMPSKVKASPIKRGFTGKKRDSAGRNQCYAQGQHVSCQAGPQHPSETPVPAAQAEAAKPASEMTDAELQAAAKAAMAASDAARFAFYKVRDRVEKLGAGASKEDRTALRDAERKLKEAGKQHTVYWREQQIRAERKSPEQAGLAAEEKASEGYDKPVAGASPTSYSLASLNKTAQKAGQALFRTHRSGLVRAPSEEIKYRSLKELKNTDAVLDEYEYVFFPSTGQGLDVAGQSWQNADKRWADKDGKIYTTYRDTVFVTEFGK